MGSEEEHDVVIVGGGICGLATALALHRKGIKSLVLERSNTLRSAGGAIGVFINGWRALDQLGVGIELRTKAMLLREIRDVQLGKLGKDKTGVIPMSKETFRCLPRSDLIEALASNLPNEAIRFGCHIVSVGIDPATSFPIIYANNGDIIKAKVLIGCDGSNSVVARSLGLQAPIIFPVSATRGITSYPNGHNLDNYFLRLAGNGILFARLPIDDKQVHWFVDKSNPPRDLELEKDPQIIRDTTIKMLKGFPEDVVEMVKQCNLSSLNLTHLRYRSPWNLLFGNLREGTTTVAGDAMHVMCSFLGQGGSAGLEDAIVLARCLAQEMYARPDGDISNQQLQQRVGMALDKYVKERRLRVTRLLTQTYLVGSAAKTSSWVKMVACYIILYAFFGGMSLSHTQYNCGHL